MACEHCGKEDDDSYTLQAQIADTDMVVDVDFCSTDCLRAWLGEEPSSPNTDADPSAASAAPTRVGQD